MNRFVQVAFLALCTLLSACNTTPIPQPVAASTTISGQIANWTRGARVLKADATLGSSGTFASLATANLEVSGQFQMTLPSTVKSNQGLYTLDGISCLRISSSNVGLQDFYGLRSFHGIGAATGIVALGSGQRLYGWMYATGDVSVVGTCSVSGGNLGFSLNLKAGWNQVALEAVSSNSIRYVSTAISADATWQYLSQVNSSFIASPVGAFKIGEPIQLRVLDKDENEITGVTWNNTNQSVASVSSSGVLTAKRLGSFTLSASLPNGGIVQIFEQLYTYGLEFSAGTYLKDGNKGTAFFAQYLGENLMPTPQDLELTIQAPTGWSATLQTLTIPAGKMWAEKLLTTPAVSGVYTAQGIAPALAGARDMSLGLLEQRSKLALSKQNSSLLVTNQLRQRANSALSRSFTIDANQTIPIPTVRWNNLSSTGLEVSYLTSQNSSSSLRVLFELRDFATNQVLATRSPQLSLSPAVQFTGLSLNQNNTYQLDVSSSNLILYTDLMQREAASVEGQFNVYQTALPVTFKPVVQALSAAGAAQAGGTKLTIEGANFTADTAVNFGNIPATSITLVSETKMDVIVPASTNLGIIDILLSNIRGSSTASAQSKFEYIKVEEFTLPDNPNGSNEPVQIQPDPQGRIWFSRSGQIGFVTNTGAFSIFALPNALGIFGVSDMDASADAMWFTYSDKLVKVSDTGVFSVYPVGGNSFGSNEVVVGHDTAIWVSNQNKNTINRYDTNGNLLSTLTATVNIRNPVRGAGQSMWFIANGSTGTAQLGKVNAANQITVFTPSNLTANMVSSILNLIPVNNDFLFYRAILATNSLLGQIQADTTASQFDTNLAIGTIIFGLDNYFWYTRQNLGAFNQENILVRLSLSREAKAFLVAPRGNSSFFDGVNQIASTSGFTWFIRSNVNKIGVINLNP
jgi:streptogramin lyase